MRSYSRIIIIFLFISLLLISNNIFAQQQAPEEIPPEARSAIEEQKAREEKEIFIPKKLKLSDVLKEEEKPTPVSEQEKKIMISKITVKGNTLIADNVLRDLIAKHELKEKTINDLNEIANELTQFYRREGYITSFAYLPPQTIKDGEVIIEIVEGKIGKVTVEGAHYFRKELIKWQFQSEPGDVMEYNRMFWDLQRLNMNPDRQVQSVLLPGENRGETDVVLKVKENFPVHVVSTINNKGTKSTGKMRFGLNLIHNNLLGINDMAQIFIQGGEHAASFFIMDEFPITNVGTNFGVSFSRGRVWPKRDLAKFDLLGNSRTLSFYLLQKFSRGQHTETTMTVGFDASSSETKVLGDRFSDDHIRVAKAGFTVRFDDPWGYNVFTEEVQFGLGEIFGGNPNDHMDSSRPGIDGDFVKNILSFYRTNPLFFKTMFNVTLKTQITDSRLASSQQFYMGGMDSLRGYLQSEVSVDNAFLANLEYVIPAFFFGDIRLPFAKKEKMKEQFSIILFYDAGVGAMRAPIHEEDSYRQLFSVGGGIRFRIRDKVYARVEAGRPLGDRSSDGEAYQIHFSVRTTVF